MFFKGVLRNKGLRKEQAAQREAKEREAAQRGTKEIEAAEKGCGEAVMGWPSFLSGAAGGLSTRLPQVVQGRHKRSLTAVP